MLTYMLRRVLGMIPPLIAISLVSFVIIQLPPGDYLTIYKDGVRNVHGLREHQVADCPGHTGFAISRRTIDKNGGTRIDSRT